MIPRPKLFPLNVMIVVAIPIEWWLIPMSPLVFWFGFAAWAMNVLHVAAVLACCTSRPS